MRNKVDMIKLTYNCEAKRFYVTSMLVHQGGGVKRFASGSLGIDYLKVYAAYLDIYIYFS